jgi:hypothetical protein
MWVSSSCSNGVRVGGMGVGCGGELEHAAATRLMRMK